MVIDISREGRAASHFDEVWIRKIISKTLQKIKRTSSRISVALVTPHSIRSLNKVYRGKDRPTDVLAFPYDHSPDMHYPKHHAYSGEIVVCPSIAKKQAHLFYNTYEAEVARLLVHGVLHLHGYDHHTRREATVMFGLTDAILSQLSLLK